MKTYHHEQDDVASVMQTMFNGMRILAGGLGMFAIVVGILYAMRVFTLIAGAMESPDGLVASVEHWAQLLGGEELNITMEGKPLRLDLVFAIAILGGGFAILAWLSLGIAATGAKILSALLADRESLKRMLVQAFGASAKYNPDRDHGGSSP